MRWVNLRNLGCIRVHRLSLTRRIVHATSAHNVVLEVQVVVNVILIKGIIVIIAVARCGAWVTRTQVSVHSAV